MKDIMHLKLAALFLIFLFLTTKPMDITKENVLIKKNVRWADGYDSEPEENSEHESKARESRVRENSAWELAEIRAAKAATMAIRHKRRMARLGKSRRGAIIRVPQRNNSNEDAQGTLCEGYCPIS